MLGTGLLWPKVLVPPLQIRTVDTHGALRNRVAHVGAAEPNEGTENANETLSDADIKEGNQNIGLLHICA